MSAVLVLARLGLAVVFAAAGVGKLADLAGSRQAVRTFGVRARPANVIGTLLPVAELAVAVSLIGAGSARWGAVGGLIALSSFCVGIAVALRAGRQPDCHCFGQLHSEPVGWRTLVRNVVLAAVAAIIVLAGPGPSLSSWFGSRPPEQVWGFAAAVVALIVAGQAALIWSLLRRHGAVLLRLRELEAGGHTIAHTEPALMIGDPAPAFDLPGLGDERLSLARLLSTGRGVLLVFTDPRCGPCQALLPRLAAWQAGDAARMTVVLLSRGSVADNLSARDTFGLRHVGLQTDREIDLRYGVIGTPSAIRLGAEGRVLGPLVTGADRIGELVGNDPGTEQRPVIGGATGAAVVTGVATGAAALTGVATGAAALTGVAAAAIAPVAVAKGSQRTAANRIAGELGDLIVKIAPETFAAGQALRGARVASPGQAIAVPAAARTAWHQRLVDIDRAHANISRISGADASRAAALRALAAVRAASRSGQLAITSPTVAKQNRYAKQQAIEQGRLGAAVKSLAATLHRAGATHL